MVVSPGRFRRGRSPLQFFDELPIGEIKVDVVERLGRLLVFGIRVVIDPTIEDEEITFEGGAMY